MSKNTLSDSKTELQIAKKQVADYATALDCLATITQYASEKETIENILNLFTILFSPKKVFYLSFKKGQPEQIYSLVPLAEDELKIRERLADFVEKYAWTESQNGFQVKIKYRGKDLGILEVDEIDFPEHIEQYVNLTMSIVDICGLSIENAGRYQVLREVKKKVSKSEQKYRLLFTNILNGFALHEILLDNNGEPIDYVFLEINKAFENLTGLNRKDILGKKVTEVLPGVEKDPVNWISRYGKVALTGQEARFERYSKPIGKWFSVLVFSPKKNQFATIFEDITKRKTTEKLLKRANTQLKKKTIALEDMNAALRVLLQKRDQDAQEVEEKIFCNYESMILPFFDKLKNSYSNRNQRILIGVLETNLREIISPFSKKLTDPTINLTPKEMQVISFIKQGFTTKEMAQTLNCAARTIDAHRNHIRIKLKIKNKKINLRSFLMNLS